MLLYYLPCTCCEEGVNPLCPHHGDDSELIEHNVAEG
jgi:hypothetical protein